jgi:hypothetical protein
LRKELFLTLFCGDLEEGDAADGLGRHCGMIWCLLFSNNKVYIWNMKQEKQEKQLKQKL